MTEIVPSFNPLMPGGNKKVTHAKTNLQLSAFVSVCVTFLLTPSIKGLMKQLKLVTLVETY